MNVCLVLTTAMGMLHVIILMEALIVPATLDLKEMESTVQVSAITVT